MEKIGIQAFHEWAKGKRLGLIIIAQQATGGVETGF
jgi:hypothetical protein